MSSVTAARVVNARGPGFQDFHRERVLRFAPPPRCGGRIDSGPGNFFFSVYIDGLHTKKKFQQASSSLILDLGGGALDL